MEIQYQSQNRTLYTTTDCNLLFTNYFDMTNPSEGTTASTNPANQQQAVNKSVRPVVDLYVMAFCPYGTQAETAMKPVVNLLGSKADIRIRYITTITGSTADTVTSLHGPAEAQEDLRQICIQNISWEKFWNYVSLFDTQCYPVSSNQDSQNACEMNISTQAGINVAQIKTCASGSQGIALLKTDESDANQNGATGSPTLIINGVTYNGARTPEAYKEAICNSFTTAPAECNTTLSGSQAAASGGCT
jgi:glutaredoxin